jgi:hypothetical protein
MLQNIDVSDVERAQPSDYSPPHFFNDSAVTFRLRSRVAAQEKTFVLGGFV